MNILQKYLTQKNETPTAFARRVGVSQPTIWRIVKGETKQISPNTAFLIEKATNGEIKALHLLDPQIKAA
jgi:DNA-binding transcriptional regulator YdaS (Cro superfamily)